MSKFRTSIIAVSLAAMFFIPMSAIPKNPVLHSEEKTPVSENSSSYPEFVLPDEEQKEKAKEEGFFRIFDLETESVQNVRYSDYVKGAIASEMGADFEFEALVAQGVAAFSCGLYQQKTHSSADYDFSAAPDKKLGYMTEEKAKEIYGDDFSEKWAKISSAAEKSMEYVLTYDGESALAVYHAISNGNTESSENAWGGTLPYLVSVKSPGDVLHPDYESKVSVSYETALELLNKNGAGLNGSYPEEWFEGEIRTEAGYVDRIIIGAATFSGEKLRSLFALRSTDFDVVYKNNEFIFTVRGYGHGVGLSQVGANHMAKEGADFEEILLHYYPGTKLTKNKD
ncbi:MAG: stage II sporulation protein D [Oscillospiraceae bacterium]|nr:stage II sporulation protein D [Oscillospiraceae bacterium]